MLSLVFLLAAGALLSHARIIDSKLDLDNSLDNVIPTIKRQPPKINIHKKMPAVTEATPGQALVLECQAMGNPNPTVSWLRNGELIADLEEQSNEIISAHQSSIGDLVAKFVVNSPRHGDVYTCLARSGLNEEASSTTVFTVPPEQDVSLSNFDELFRLPTAPVITAIYDSVLQEEQSNLVLLCRVSSRTKVRLQWRHNGEPLNNKRYKLLPSGDLLIMNLKWDEDMGDFACTATNAYGSDKASTFVYPMAI